MKNAWEDFNQENSPKKCIPGIAERMWGSKLTRENRLFKELDKSSGNLLEIAIWLPKSFGRKKLLDSWGAKHEKEES